MSKEERPHLSDSLFSGKVKHTATAMSLSCPRCFFRLFPFRKRSRARARARRARSFPYFISSLMYNSFPSFWPCLRAREAIPFTRSGARRESLGIVTPRARYKVSFALLVRLSSGRRWIRNACARHPRFFLSLWPAARPVSAESEEILNNFDRGDRASDERYLFYVHDFNILPPQCPRRTDVIYYCNFWYFFHMKLFDVAVGRFN